VTRENFFQFFESFGDDLWTALELQLGIVVDDACAIDAAIAGLVFHFEPLDQLVKHQVQIRIVLLIFGAFAGIQPEHTAGSGESAADLAAIHAAQQPGHSSHQVRIAFTLFLQGQLHQDLTATESLSVKFEQAKR
jgi:hypothetical protein